MQIQRATGERRRTCVGEIDDGEEDQAGSQGHPEEEEGLELLPGEPVFQVLQEGVGLQQRKHTCGGTRPNGPRSVRLRSCDPLVQDPFVLSTAALQLSLFALNIYIHIKKNP